MIQATSARNSYRWSALIRSLSATVKKILSNLFSDHYELIIPVIQGTAFK
jgi:hypothetical protein